MATPVASALNLTMLFEVYRYLTSRTSAEARRFGYLKAAIALEARHRRCRAAWAPHLEACRQEILKQTDACADFGVALILGSGLLLDLPLSRLAARFQRVVLVDMVHLPPVRKALRRYANVQLLQVDLTGLVKPMLAGQAPDPAHVPKPQLVGWEDADFVVSLNILSQLPLLPIDYAARRFDLTEPQQEQLGHSIISKHIDWLAALPGHSCLLTDRVQRRIPAQGQAGVAPEQIAIDLLYGYALPKPASSWEWLIAPAGEIESAHAFVHDVCALTITQTPLPKLDG